MTKIAIVAVAALALTGCNTVAGVGKDVSAVGGVMTKTANGAARAKPVRTACLPDSRVPSRPCPPAYTAKAKSTTRQAAKAAPVKQVEASATKQTADASATPVKTSSKTSAKPKSGWWQ